MNRLFTKRFFYSKSFIWMILGGVILLALLVFFSFIGNLSIHDNYDTISSEKINNEVNVYFNNFGIPHIIGSGESDIFFAIGYMHARDRLFQMDILRRTASGELSEIFGSETIKLDKFFKALSLKDASEKSFQLLDKAVKNALEMYSEGINKFIIEEERRFSFEFSALDYKPKLWQPLHSILIAKLMAFDMSPGFISDICIAEISEKKGVRKALSLVPDYPVTGPCITDLDYKPRDEYEKIKTDDSLSAVTESEVAHSIYESISDFLYRYSSVSAAGGSNSWVVRKNPKNRNVILANDPHMKLSLPSYWYPMHVSCNTLNVVGLTIPGAPFFLIGRSDNISWGISVMMLDDCDFFIERIDETNEKYYLTPNGKSKFRYRADTIIVRNEDPIYYYQRMTENSAVISDNYIMKEPSFLLDIEKDTTMSFDFYDKFLLTFKWTGSLPDKNYNSLYNILKAKNWKEFNLALNDWSAPGLNWSYADTKGNMGIRPAGIIPKRKETNPLIPNPGWLTEYQWVGYYSSDDIPRVYNPPKDFVASSNNKTDRNSAIYISNYYEPPSRAQRVQDLIFARKEFDVRNVQIMQLDNYSNYADELLFYVLPYLENSLTEFKKTEKIAFDILNKWDRIFSPAYAAPSIFNVFYKHLNKNIFHDHMGERLFRTYNYIPQFAHLKLLELVKDKDSYWFDNIRTKAKEDAEIIIIRSFKDACLELSEVFNTQNVYSWKLSELQLLELKHPFSSNPFLKSVVSGGEYRMPGNFTSINKADWRIYSDYKVLIGTSARFIADMQDTVIWYSILGGVSGDPISPNYKDQAMFFINGGYIQTSATKNPDKNSILRLQFFPE